MKPSLLAVSFAGLALCVGCGPTDKGIQVSGTVTYDGKAVPAGKIYFNPDTKKQGDGQQGFANIKDGAYNTANGGQGAPSGAIIVRVEGFDGATDSTRPMGHAVFVFSKADQIPSGGPTTKDFSIKADEAVKAVKDTGPEP